MQVIHPNFINIKSTLYSFYFYSMHPIGLIATDNMVDNCHFLNYSSESESPMMIDPYLLSIMNYQNYLNFELLKNQNLIATYLTNYKIGDKFKSSSLGSSSTSEGNQNLVSSFPLLDNSHLLKNDSPQLRSQGILQKEAITHRGQKPPKKQKKYSQDSDYEPQKSDPENSKPGKSSESKNVPKNFSKAILLFIKKKQNMIKVIVEQAGLNFQEFMNLTTDLKGNINSISELRSMWIDDLNKFARIYRIISNLYLRRFSLPHIFNSRVEDFGKHLKYRNKISQVLRNPREFTRMKDY